MPNSTVYYWFKRNALDTGHAALAINAELYMNLGFGGTDVPGLDRVYPDDLYVSWLGAGYKGFMKGHRGVNNDFIADEQGFGAYKIHRVNLGSGLDRMAMIEEWRSVKDKEGGAHWRLTNKNCATVVRRVLKAGGCDRYVRRWDLKHGMSSPQKVYHYAKNARKHLPGV